MANLLDLLRSRPAIASGVLAHKYLKNTLLLPSERAAAGRLAERPELVDEMTDIFREIDETFLDGYDPSAFVQTLRSFQTLNPELRNRLYESVRSDYLLRFRPVERLDTIRQSAAVFLTALHKWSSLVAAVEVGSEASGPWSELQRSAANLRDLLEDRELSTRWIP